MTKPSAPGMDRRLLPAGMDSTASLIGPEDGQKLAPTSLFTPRRMDEKVGFAILAA